MLAKTRAIVLRNTNYSESSVISKMYTREFGMRTYLLQGVKKGKSPIRPSMIMPLSLVEMDVYEKATSNLNRVKELKSSPALLNIQDDIYIKFNNTEFQRIIDNNLSNAIKYSYAKSPIFVRLDYISDEEVEFSVTTHSKKIEYQNKIFDDFYRENSARGGFGLGLRIVKEICDKNLVTIQLDSNEKETKFTYRFKINEDTTT